MLSRQISNTVHVMSSRIGLNGPLNILRIPHASVVIELQSVRSYVDSHTNRAALKYALGLRTPKVLLLQKVS